MGTKKWFYQSPGTKEYFYETGEVVEKLKILATLRSQDFDGHLKLDDIDLRDSVRGRKCSYRGCVDYKNKDATKSDRHVRGFEGTYVHCMKSWHFSQINLCRPKHKQRFMEKWEQYN